MAEERFVIDESGEASKGVPLCRTLAECTQSKAFAHFWRRFFERYRRGGYPAPYGSEYLLSLMISAAKGERTEYSPLKSFLSDRRVRESLRTFIAPLVSSIPPTELSRVDPEMWAFFDSVFFSHDADALVKIFNDRITGVVSQKPASPAAPPPVAPKPVLPAPPPTRVRPQTAAPSAAASAPSVNTARLSWNKVPRERDVHMFGDTNGSIESLANLEHSGIVEIARDARWAITGLAWRGGDSVAVVVGDIFADRNLESFRLSKAFRILREQARRSGGDVVVLYGNHDEFALSFLTGLRIGTLRDCIHEEQGLGLLEFNKFLPDGIAAAKLASGTREDLSAGRRFAPASLELAMKQLATYRDDLLPNMRRDPEWRALLEDLCEMKLVHRVQDICVVHTDPTQKVVDLLLAKGIDGVNREWSGNLRKILIEGDKSESVLDSLRRLADTMLDTGNRAAFASAESARRLRDQGINLIVHGHSHNRRQFDPKYVDGVGVSCIDSSAFKFGIPPAGVPKTRSVLSVLRDGSVRAGINDEPIAMRDIA